MIRGQKYRFNNTTGSSHPFEFRIADGGSAYSNGVSGDDEGVQFFTVPYDAPAKIFYQCTIHGGMVGNIYIRGAGGQNDNVGVTTFVGAVRQTGNPVFYVQMTTSNYTLTTTETALVYNEAKVNVGNHYNTSNGRFTAPVTGLYEFGYAALGHNTADVFRYTLYINGTKAYNEAPQLRIDTTQSNNQYGTNGEFVVYRTMTAGQYAQVYAKSDGGDDGFSNNSTGYTYFRGRLIG